MRLREAVALWLLLGLGLCGCTRTSEVRTSERTDLQETVRAREREQSTETVQSGPETITTTVEEYEENPTASVALPPASSVKDGAVRTTGGVSARGATSNVPATPVLVKRTVTVDQRGPVVATKTEAATMATTASLTGKQEKASDTKKRTSYWPPWWLWAIGAVGVALGIAVLRKTLLGKAVAAAEAAVKEVL